MKIEAKVFNWVCLVVIIMVSIFLGTSIRNKDNLFSMIVLIISIVLLVSGLMAKGGIYFIDSKNERDQSNY